MKKISLFLISLLIATVCFSQQKEKITEESLKLEEKLDARLPVTSQAQVGHITKRKIDLSSFSQPLFILGGDPFSFNWLKEHATELEEKHAIGFITNIDNSSRLEEFQRLTKAPLLPANIDELLVIFHENHYPFIIYKDEIWQ
ncbi:integrating conjugative element protein, PFL_4695 family [Legionella busanensis]|uniref:Integrating conjugative element protein, PFL_4695 family n=1 Tax=Legionella busanensis TaxID=190655 RepID=A0A378JHZ9_9GAMM|nr:integrating conjugative element protein [Legionella busanensis]STX50936.1 integrating conjugative element protein, PFL_4695 family [Legionella busanensis]